MSMNAGEYKTTDFTPVVGAMELADYVFNITDNLNKFPDYATKETKNPDGSVTQMIVFRSDSLTNVVRKQANDIYMLAYAANEINLNKQPWRKAERLGKQEEAIKLCGEHLAEIQLCRKHFHLTNKKIKNWGGMTRTVRKALESWHEKDVDRYRNI